MKTKLLCLCLAFLMLFSLVACNKEEEGGIPDATRSEHYLPEALFAEVQTAFSKKNATDFPKMDYNDAPFLIADNAFAGKTIAAIVLPVRSTGGADAEGMLQFTLYVMPNTYNALINAAKKNVVTHVIKIKPEDHGIAADRKTVCQYITVDLTAYDLQLTADQTLAIGSKTDTIHIASMNTSKTAAGSASVIKTWREEWLTTGYYSNLFTGKTGEKSGGLYYSCNSLPIDFIFDYGSADAKQAVLDAREAEQSAYAQKLAAVASAYNGKYLSLIGDSISSFSGVTDNTKYSNILINNRCYYSSSNMNDYTQMYWGRLAEECDMELCVINGWSSSRVYGGGKGRVVKDQPEIEANKDKLDNMLVRSMALQNNAGQKPDVILLYMGINDVSNSPYSDLYELLTAPGRTKSDKEIVAEWFSEVESYAAQGGFDPSDPTTVTFDADTGKSNIYTSWEASYALSLKCMRESYPDAEIYIINLTRSHHGSGTEEKITKANTCLSALAAYYGVDVIDQANNEVNYENCHLFGADEANPTALHPNLRGHAALTKLIVETMYEKLPK